MSSLHFKLFTSLLTLLGSALYWVATQHMLVGGTVMLSRNVGNELPIYPS